MSEINWEKVLETNMMQKQELEKYMELVKRQTDEIRDLKKVVLFHAENHQEMANKIYKLRLHAVNASNDPEKNNIPAYLEIIETLQKKLLAAKNLTPMLRDYLSQANTELEQYKRAYDSLCQTISHDDELMRSATYDNFLNAALMEMEMEQ